jgi:hypothetical protein
MEHKKKLEELHRESLAKVDEYLKSKSDIGPEHHEKIREAKKEWEASWNRFLEALLMLEQLEI